MTALEMNPNPGAVRAWAVKNGIPISKTGKIARHVRDCYVEANPTAVLQQSSELQVRNSRPDLFALADDMAEAELIRTGRLSFSPPVGEVQFEEPRSLAEWLRIRDELAAAIAEHSNPREAAEALLVHGWMKTAAA
ncbi:hypothetical protein LJR044_003169 [Microbacterium foliorum]